MTNVVPIQGIAHETIPPHVSDPDVLIGHEAPFSAAPTDGFGMEGRPRLVSPRGVFHNDDASAAIRALIERASADQQAQMPQPELVIVPTPIEAPQLKAVATPASSTWLRRLHLVK